MTRIERLKAQVVALQEEYEKNMHRLEEIISERAEMVFRMIDLTKSIYTDDVVCRMIYNQVTETGLIKRIEDTYKKIEKIKLLISILEAKYYLPVVFNLNYYNDTTDKNAKTIEECILKLYCEKRKISVYSLGVTHYTQNLIYRETEKREKNS